MSKDRMFEDYGVQMKTPLELIEEFTTEMMMQHHIMVKGINFDQQDLEKVSASLMSKVRPEDPVFSTEFTSVVTVVYTSAGKIKLGVDDE